MTSVYAYGTARAVVGVGSYGSEGLTKNTSNDEVLRRPVESALRPGVVVTHEPG